MKKFQFLTLITCAWVLGPLKIQAQNTYALIIGIAQYKKMPALQYADRDAIAFAEFVKGQGVPDQNVSLFLNEDATRMNIVDELYRLSRRLKPQDRFYFYFGGHGDLEAKIGYENAMLLLHGSFKTGYFQGKEFLQLSELKTWLTALSKTQTQVIFIADACHSGGLIGGSEGQTKTQRALQESWANVTKILSSQANEFSLEGQQWGGGRGLFSFHLVNGLTGRADVNKNKLVSVKELDEYLRYHVRSEASPNVQTPLVVGEPTLALSKSSASGLAQLAIAEKLNFPVISVVNFKGGNPVEKLLAKLDTGIVEFYKRFSKAVKERRLADHDNAQDNALLHFRAMAGRNIPDTLLNIMKRNLGAALMERELTLMKALREKGNGYGLIEKETILPAIANLDEVVNLFGEKHYFYNLLQARKLALESRIPLYNSGMKMAIDESKKLAVEYSLKQRSSLLKSLLLEPNMISTYALLASSYEGSMPDSAIYYQEKVVDLLPNQAFAYFNIGLKYIDVEYTDANKRLAPHPKAIEYLEKTIQLDSTLQSAYEILANIYNGETYEDYQDYPKAIPYLEKTLGFYEKSDEELLRLGLNKEPADTETFKFNRDKSFFAQQLYFYAQLLFYYKEIGNLSQSEVYFKKLHQKVTLLGTVHAYLNAGLKMFEIFRLSEDDLYLAYALDFFELALKKGETELRLASLEGRPFLGLQYRELLKALGVAHRVTKKYDEAEKFFQQALDYPVTDSLAKGRLKYQGSFGMVVKDRIIWFPMAIRQNGPDYNYHIEANVEMFILKLEQNRLDEALTWYEKAMQVSVAEYGNDSSSNIFIEIMLKTYKNLDKGKFLALRNKYFPDIDKK